MLTGHHINLADPAYAPSLLRPSSPSSSIGTDYGPDESTQEERDKPFEQIARECDERLMLSAPRPEEEEANREILIRRPKLPDEERALHKQVMENLRNAVRKLQEEELYENIMLRGTQITDVQQPLSDNIDAIMQSIMAPPGRSTIQTSLPPPPPFPQSPSVVASPTHSHTSVHGTAGLVASDAGSPNASPTKRPTRTRKGTSRRRVSRP